LKQRNQKYLLGKLVLRELGNSRHLVGVQRSREKDGTGLINKKGPQEDKVIYNRDNSGQHMDKGYKIGDSAFIGKQQSRTTSERNGNKRTKK
jgi:hypothetical protein